jgi:hypothetical protein
MPDWCAVPKPLVWDNEPGVGRGRPTTEFAALAGLLATRIHFCRPRDPEAKGLVERANGYPETSFLPGRVFTGPGDFNTQLTAWLQVANRRRHRTIDARPVDRWEADRASMLTLPPVGPPNWWPQTTRLGRDHYIRVDTCNYSVHPRAIGHRITVRTDIESITVTCGDDTVARHVRCWVRRTAGHRRRWHQLPHSCPPGLLCQPRPGHESPPLARSATGQLLFAMLRAARGLRILCGTRVTMAQLSVGSPGRLQVPGPRRSSALSKS